MDQVSRGRSGAATDGGSPVKNTCPAKIAAFSRSYPKRSLKQAAKLNITAVDVKASKATVTVQLAGQVTSTVALVKSGGGWKLPDLAIWMPSS